jgi:hypothetical protein
MDIDPVGQLPVPAMVVPASATPPGAPEAEEVPRASTRTEMIRVARREILCVMTTLSLPE